MLTKRAAARKRKTTNDSNGDFSRIICPTCHKKINGLVEALHHNQLHRHW